MLKKQGYTVTKTTVINWLRQYNLAIKPGGRWQIDKNKFVNFLLVLPIEKARGLFFIYQIMNSMKLAYLIESFGKL
ncbi:MAG: hypothetical protein DYG83_09530 [Candidatus Brocadia sp. AMX2]|uniref:Uncharacterized phage-encoded protein n=1 Tax=Candidatus Brocadia sinica JPN1 TaxID=1197129 RepID=A0ABQ0JYK1_9BACT|nr:MAG: hypothetical protein EDM70_05290 [Candidatus Brocadia sp. AMX2]KXK28855.1 MAG: hypothetical protein UZ01_02473 [Candidatus Brocadia sinica]MBC6932606.1 hypothetical protein [Candidatus Brocadia sp.]MBL1169890.1 hypothetical protein [Candidatus Brocadia sp. AMX1]GAN33554.1 uncharacterized phage-encoded protein [Candidatus Brocadia sinica JPN1]